MPGLQIDLVDAILGQLEQVLAVERGSRMRRDVDGAQRGSTRRIEGDQLAARGKPDVLAVVGNAMHAVHSREGPILTNNLGGGSAHALILVSRQRSGE